MTKRVIFIGAWTLVFPLGSGVLLFLASELFNSVVEMRGSQPSDLTRELIVTIILFGPLFFAPVGITLGILGILPGTRKKA